MDVSKRKYFSGDALTPDELRQELSSERAGTVMIRNAAPPGLLIVQNYLSPAACEKIIAECDTMQGGAGKVLTADAGGAIERRNAESRKVDTFDIGGFSLDIEKLVGASLKDVVGPHYGVEIEWFERPNILRYPLNGEYYAHADAYNWNEEKKNWRRVANRDYSLLIYLNENYEGGQLDFKYLNYRITPMQGLLVAFPSDWRYAHAAMAVTKGRKYSIVSFSAAKGGPRSDGPLPENLVRL